MTAIETVTSVLNEQFAAFQNAESDQFELARQLIGAATLARSVADRHGDLSLQELAGHVINWVNEWEENLEFADQQANDHAQKTWNLRKNIERQTFRLVKGFVGKEHQNSTWMKQVDLYQAEFPSFIVRESVYKRISSKEQAARLRAHLLSRLLALKLDRSPKLSEIEDSLPAALVDLTEETLSYLGKALPGFDFRSQMVSI